MNGARRRWVGGWLVGLAGLAGAADPPAVTQTGPAVPTVEELALNLGSSSYAVRERAGRELWLRGAAARDALAAAAAAGNPEAARRARAILDKFEWGVFPDTPPAALALIDEFRSNVPERQTAAVDGLLKLGPPGVVTLRAVLNKTVPADVKGELAKEPADSAWRRLSDHVARAVRREVLSRLLEDKRAEADALVSLVALGGYPAGLADHAAYHYLRGTLPAAVTSAEAVAKAGGPAAEPAKLVLVHLYRAQGAWAKAREAAADVPHVPGEAPLLDLLLEEQGDWAELARRDPAGVRRANLPDGLRLTFLRLSGKAEAFDALAGEVRAAAADAGASRSDVQQAAYSLLLNGRAADATDLLLARRQDLGLLAELLIAKMRYADALALVGGKADADAPDPEERTGFDLRRARLLFVLGRRDDAVKAFGEAADALRLNPEGGRSLHGTGVSFRSLLRAEVRLGLRDLAADHAAAFLTSDDERLRGLTRSGETPFEILFDTDAKAAEATFWALRAKAPGGEAAGESLRLVRSLFTGTASKEAVERAVKAITDASGSPLIVAGNTPSRTPASPDPAAERHLAAATVLRAAKRHDEAEAAYRLAAEAARPTPAAAAEEGGGSRSWVYGTTDDFRPWVELGDYLADHGRHADAAKAFEAGWRRFPDQPILLYLCGRSLGKAGDAAEGARRADLAHWVSLGNERVRGRFLEELVRRGAAKAAARETDLLLRACWSRDGYFGNVMNQAGRAAVLNRDFATAERCVQRSVLVLLKRPGVHFVEAASYLTVPQNMAAHRARALLAAGKIDEALSQAGAVLDAQPGASDLVIGMVPELDKAGRTQDADALFRRVWDAHAKVAADHPASASARNSAAWLAANCRRELDAALDHATKAVAADPTSVAYRETLAEVHFRRGDRAKATAIMAALADEAPRSRLFRRQLERYKTGDAASPQPDTEPE